MAKRKYDLIRRAKASKEGALVGAATYSLVILIMNLLNQTFYTLPKELFYLASPGSLLQGVWTTESIIMGIPTNILFLNLVIYITAGYLVDWLVDPYE